MSATPLIQVENLSKYFPVQAGSFAAQAGAKVRAVHNVSFQLAAGRILGLVGESGCGKSTTGRLVLRLITPSAGRVLLDGQDVTAAKGKELKRLRRRMQIIFQDPLGSLNPRMTIANIISEPLVVHGVRASKRRERLAELLILVELPDDCLARYPHEFSGGQRQRIAIARALALSPELIVADEPVSALDASIQAQILTLMQRLQRELGMAFLFISHDLSVVRHICHEVAVMYLGEIVERGPIAAVYDDARHPYTQALLQAVPRAEPDVATVTPLAGQLPSAINPPPGCVFASRCPHVHARCHREPPTEVTITNGHGCRCWLNEPSAEASST